MSYGRRKCANDELLSYFHVEASIHRPSFFLFFSLTIKDKTKISLTIKILHLGQGSFTRKVRTIYRNYFCETLFNLSFILTTIFYRKNFCEKGYCSSNTNLKVFSKALSCMAVISESKSLKMPFVIIALILAFLMWSYAWFDDY